MELALIAEGTSDKVLVPPIHWLCIDISPNQSYEIEPIIFDSVTPKPDLSANIEIVLRQNRHPDIDLTSRTHQVGYGEQCCWCRHNVTFVTH